MTYDDNESGCSRREILTLGAETKLGTLFRISLFTTGVKAGATVLAGIYNPKSEYDSEPEYNNSTENSSDVTVDEINDSLEPGHAPASQTLEENS